MSYLSTKTTIKDYSENTKNNTDINELNEFPTLRDYCLYVCGGDFTAFDNYNTLAIEMMNDELNKGIPIC